ncbi:MAG: NADPH-dependent reductase [Segetibacter sp.]|nr:NADPH-dependent reductase [Segetibacter sp.]
MSKKNIIAISGSTRQNSINHSLIKAIADLSAASLDITIFDGIENLPQFNPDNDGDNVAKEILDFRQQLNKADGIIICTPEYAHGVPGTLKNAIDWTISSSQFPHKPTLLITASTGGHYGHKALMETLKAIEAKNIDQHQMVIPFAKTKISADNKITDEKTLADVKALVTAFIETLND